MTNVTSQLASSNWSELGHEIRDAQGRSHAAGKRTLMVGVDAGETFTDFVAYDGRGFRVHKLLSSPEAPERAILAGIEALGLSEAGFCIIHGTTVATKRARARGPAS